MVLVVFLLFVITLCMGVQSNPIFKDPPEFQGEIELPLDSLYFEPTPEPVSLRQCFKLKAMCGKPKRSCCEVEVKKVEGFIDIRMKCFSPDLEQCKTWKNTMYGDGSEVKIEKITPPPVHRTRYGNYPKKT